MPEFANLIIEKVTFIITNHLFFVGFTSPHQFIFFFQNLSTKSVKEVCGVLQSIALEG